MSSLATSSMAGLAFADVNGTTLHYALRPAQSGHVDAPVMVCLNSLGTDMRIWDGVAAQFPEFAILQFDMRGHGLSTGRACSLRDITEDVAELMDRLGLSDAVICGVSVGGMVAQDLAAHRPELVKALVLCCTGARIGDMEAWNDRISIVERKGLGAVADTVMGRWFAHGFKSERPAEWNGYHAMLSRTPADGYSGVCAAIRDADLFGIVRELDVPALALAGSEDHATPVETVKELAYALPNCRFEILENVGHLPCIEAPDRTAALIRRFLGDVL